MQGRTVGGGEVYEDWYWGMEGGEEAEWVGQSVSGEDIGCGSERDKEEKGGEQV